jgi:hypothetical protein
MHHDAPRPHRARSALRILVLALVALLASGALNLSAAAPARRLALGVSMVEDRDQATYDAFVAQTGRAPAIWSFWSDWGTPSTQWLPDTALLDYMSSKGTVPLLIWQPVDSRDPSNDLYSYYKIARTNIHVPYITEFAKQVAAYRKRVLIRFAHEFDGRWFPWGVERGGQYRFKGNTPQHFRAAWQRIVRIFRANGAGNARFIWSPSGSGGARWMKELYPGSAYVDHLGFTAFNWANWQPRTGWKSLPTIVSAKLKVLGGLSKTARTKPIIITELGSHYLGGNKRKWIEDGYAAVYARWPRIKAAVYFNVNMRVLEPGRKENWLLVRGDDRSALYGYRKLLSNWRYRGTVR